MRTSATAMTTLLLAGLLVASRPAGAAPPAKKAKASAQADGEAGERFYGLGVRYTRSGKYERALEMFLKALPSRRHGSDIYYNLVAVAEPLKRWDLVNLYALGFLYHEPDTKDAKVIARKRAKAVRAARRAGAKAPSAVHLAIEPADAEVWVNGVPVGHTGKATVPLLPGRYEIHVELEDYLPWDKEIEVPGIEPVEVTGQVERMKLYGSLQVFPSPKDGVEVFVDEKSVGKTPMGPVKLLVGRHLIRFALPGWDRWVRYVTIERDQTFELRPVLEKTPGAPAQP